jgi:hypothetical protein
MPQSAAACTLFKPINCAAANRAAILCIFCPALTSFRAKAHRPPRHPDRRTRPQTLNLFNKLWGRPGLAERLA